MNKMTCYLEFTIQSNSKIGEKYPYSTWSGCKTENHVFDVNIQIKKIVDELKDKIPILLQR